MNQTIPFLNRSTINFSQIFHPSLNRDLVIIDENVKLLTEYYTKYNDIINTLSHNMKENDPFNKLIYASMNYYVEYYSDEDISFLDNFLKYLSTRYEITSIHVNNNDRLLVVAEGMDKVITMVDSDTYSDDLYIQKNVDTGQYILDLSKLVDIFKNLNIDENYKYTSLEIINRWILPHTIEDFFFVSVRNMSLGCDKKYVKQKHNKALPKLDKIFKTHTKFNHSKVSHRNLWIETYHNCMMKKIYYNINLYNYKYSDFLAMFFKSVLTALPDRTGNEQAVATVINLVSFLSDDIKLSSIINVKT